ncbi:MAG: serine protease [Bacteroidota bacterium]
MNRVSRGSLVFLLLFFCTACTPVSKITSPYETNPPSKKEWQKTIDQVETLEKIEGIWSISNSTIEFVVIKNNTEWYPEYDFIGVITTVHSIENDPESTHLKPGDVWLLLNRTAVNEVFKGIAVRNKWGFQQVEIASLVVMENNFISLTANEDELYAIRSYPIGEQIGNRQAVDGDNSPSQFATGTGFLIGNSKMVTNMHVIAKSKSVSAYYLRNEYKCKLIGKDENNDLALLELTGLPDSLSSLGLSFTATSSVNVGDDVFTIGYPLIEELGEQKKFTSGSISSSTGIQDDPRMFQVSIPIQPGNSGGPLLNKYGDVVGVVSATINPLAIIARHKALPQGVNYAIKAPYVRSLVESFGGQVLTSESQIPLTPSEIFAKTGKCVFLIRAVQ